LGAGSAFSLEFPAQRHGRKGSKAAEKSGNMAQELEQLLDDDSHDEKVNQSVKQPSLLQATELDTVDFQVDAAAKQSAPKIVVADDQQINLEAIKANLMEINAHQNAEYFVNGQLVIDYVKRHVTEALAGDLKATTRPVHALLLDF